MSCRVVLLSCCEVSGRSCCYLVVSRRHVVSCRVMSCCVVRHGCPGLVVICSMQYAVAPTSRFIRDSATIANPWATAAQRMDAVNNRLIGLGKVGHVLTQLLRIVYCVLASEYFVLCILESVLAAYSVLCLCALNVYCANHSLYAGGQWDRNRH
jgi:hypothetical protein